MERHIYPRTVVLVSFYYENPTQRLCVVQSGHHNPHLIEIYTRHDIAVNKLSFGVKQQVSFTHFTIILRTKMDLYVFTVRDKNK